MKLNNLKNYQRGASTCTAFVKTIWLLHLAFPDMTQHTPMTQLLWPGGFDLETKTKHEQDLARKIATAAGGGYQ